MQITSDYQDNEILSSRARLEKHLQQWTQAANHFTSYDVDDEKNAMSTNSPITKDLLDARLETIEVRMDARMTRIEELIGDTRHEIGLMRQESKSIRTTMIVTGISSVLAIVLGVGAFNATVLSNMVASFESGKNTATMHTTLNEATKALEAATAKAQAASVNTQPKQ